MKIVDKRQRTSAGQLTSSASFTASVESIGKKIASLVSIAH